MSEHIQAKIHYNDVIMSTMSQITGISIYFSTVASGADQRNIKALRHQSLYGKSPVTAELGFSMIHHHLDVW